MSKSKSSKPTPKLKKHAPRPERPVVKK
jgi:hypothetical protein